MATEAELPEHLNKEYENDVNIFQTPEDPNPGTLSFPPIQTRVSHLSSIYSYYNDLQIPRNGAPAIRILQKQTSLPPPQTRYSPSRSDL